VQFTAYGRQTVPDRGVVRSCDPLQNFWGPIISPEQLNLKSSNLYASKLYINSNHRVTYHQHVTVLKFCRLSWCCASRGFVSDSWATYCYPRGARDARVLLAMITCLSVCMCLCATRWYCIKKAKRRITRTTPRDSTGILVFWHQVSLVDDPLRHFALKVTHPPFEHQKFGQYPLTAPQPWEIAIKVEITLIGSWPRAFQQAIDEPRTLPLSP